MSRAIDRAILLLLCGTLASAHFGCASRSRGSAPVPDPNLAASSPAPARASDGAAPRAYARPAHLQRWSDSMRKGREDLRLGNLEAAEESFLAALEATRQMRPGDVRIDVTLSNLQRLADRYRKAKRPDDFARVAEVVVAASPPRSARPELATLLTQLGRLQLERGQTDEAASSFERALDIRTRVEGQDAASVVALYGQLSRVELARKNLAAASAHIERAIEIQEASSRTETALFVAVLVDLAKLRVAQERYDDARASLSRALEIARLLELKRTQQIEDLLLALEEQDPWDSEAPREPEASETPEESEISASP